MFEIDQKFVRAVVATQSLFVTKNKLAYWKQKNANLSIALDDQFMYKII